MRRTTASTREANGAVRFFMEAANRILFKPIIVSVGAGML
jgi:hypothetical protein